MDFGEKLKILRVLNGKTQTEFARETGVQQSVIARYEKENTLPHTKLLKEFAENLNISENLGWLKGSSPIKFHYILFRPLSPYVQCMPSGIKSIDKCISDLLPKLIKELDVDRVTVLTSQIGSVFVATDSNKNRVMIIVCRNEIQDSVNTVAPNYDTIQIPGHEMLNILCFGFDFIGTILNHCGIKTPALLNHYNENCQIIKSKPVFSIRLKAGNKDVEKLKGLESLITDYCTQNSIDVNELEISGGESLDPLRFLDPILVRYIDDKKFKVDKDGLFMKTGH